ncbi:hypothetical protein PAHAL_9G454400 [Panicum hallii]|uniref:MADS-box domain-containing protein n=2 Tax=Panicum hallii TaxID=206008 RepID=A0A2T8I4R5_9POAL|nr:hypothetical protein PAHAL_9G454400 [Panicum hallii]
MGRQKIEMKRIEGEESRHVCFSKRRQSMFKKACELSILCSAMVAIVVFSPGGRPFSFGSPSFKAVFNRFLALTVPATSGESCDSSNGETNTTHESLECSELEQSIEGEKKREKMLKEAVECDTDGRVMDLLTTKVYTSGLDELQEFHKKLAAIQGIVKEKIKQVLQEESHPTKPFPPAFMDLASKYLLDRLIATRIPSMAPNSNHGVAGGLDVNASLASSVYAVGTPPKYPSNQLDG